MGKYQNLSNIDNLETGLYHLRDITEGLFYLFLPLSISIIIFLIGVTSNKKLSFTCAASSFAFGILSSILSFQSLLSPYYAIVGFVLTGVCLVWAIYDKS
jgi:hypothetical protein